LATSTAPSKAVSRQDHCELLSAVAGGQIGRTPARRAESRRHPPQTVVARLMAVAVVESLEMIDIERISDTGAFRARRAATSVSR